MEKVAVPHLLEVLVMRVELLYHPECNLYKSVHRILEDVIAEERLPIPVEMVEDKAHSKAPSIRIDGHVIFIKTGSTFDHLQSIVSKKWAEVNHSLKHRC
jgi:hypothetical protein